MGRHQRARSGGNVFPVSWGFYSTLSVFAGGLEDLEAIRNEVLYFYRGGVSFSEAEAMPFTKLLRVQDGLRELLRSDGKIK